MTKSKEYLLSWRDDDSDDWSTWPVEFDSKPTVNDIIRAAADSMEAEPDDFVLEEAKIVWLRDNALICGVSEHGTGYLIVLSS